MQCVFHPTQMTGVRCHHCQRAICQACDHRIKGSPYCQECIVAGINALRHQAAPPYGQAWPPPANNKSPLIATFFALVPGLGAAYNGQHVKALCHFVLPVSLWQLASLLGDFPAFAFTMGGGALYLFSLFDAWQTAQRARAGADLAAEDARIKHWLQNNVFVWGVYLLGIGALTALDQLAPRFVHRAWPLLFLIAVAYSLRGLFKTAAPVAPPETPYQPRPVSFMATGMTTGLSSTYDSGKEPAASNLINAEHRFDRWG
ncbi:MAG: hypothetical protein HOP19_18195 [Acidobacteria bacterium]|nr:hypothetical protein [Acidobacteriota bacterium]